MKKLTPLEILNQAISEHSVASGYGPVKKDEDTESAGGGRHSASAQETLAARHGKPSSRAAFNSAHSEASSNGFKKPLAPKPPAMPAKPKPISPIKPLMPLKPGG